VRLGFDGVFAALSLMTVLLISASCYFEEWMYKRLPNFNYFWTVALAELFVFSVMSVAFASCGGALRSLLAERRAPLHLYALQALTMAVYAAVAKIAYKYLNYATGTVLRSTKLVFVMAISVAWLGRRYSAWEYASAFAMIAAVACFGLGEQTADQGGEDHTMGYALSVLGLGLAALQTNMADNAMRDFGASTLENMLYVNVLGLVVTAICTIVVDGREAWEYMRTTPHATELLALRSLTFYFGALAFTELTRHSGATPATSVATARKGLTVIGSFVLFPGDKPFSLWFGGGIALFLVAIGLELKARIDRGKAREAGGK
jgi:adenosine 3'-phospho 5'-phosphosulfate transporter B3